MQQGNKIIFITIFLVGIIVIFFLTSSYTRYKIYNTLFNTLHSRTQRIYIGFALDHVTDKNITQLQNSIAYPYTIVMTYKQWGNTANSKISSDILETFDKNGKIPLITWEPWDPTKGTLQSDYQLKKIAEGKYDAYILSTAENIHVYGKPIFLRFAQEMNIDRYPWSGMANNNTPQDYISAWRHIHNLFLSVGVKNVTWVWSPNVNGDQLMKYYPGDSYVDWVGLDGYNWGNTSTGTIWQSFSNIFLPDYLTEISFTKKPVMIAETASTELGGSKANWIADAYQNQIPNNFTQISAVIWFNVNKETNWKVDSSTSSLSEFKKSLKLDMYKVSPNIENNKIFPESF